MHRRGTTPKVAVLVLAWICCCGDTVTDSAEAGIPRGIIGRMDDAKRLTYPDPELTDDQVVLRPWRFDDLPCIEEASGDPAIPETTTVPEPFTAAEGRAFIVRQWNRQTDGEGLSLAIADKTDGRARGLVVLLLRQVKATAGIGYWIVPNARESTRATRAVRLLSRWALTQGDIERVEALVELENLASKRVLESCGFQPEGVLQSRLAFGTHRADALSFSLLTTDIADS
jgi:RimJ/RimL family protein N-acetyltransferase